MIKHHLISTLRSIRKQRPYSYLNIIGLATGLTCFILIALWVNDELSYDRFNANYERIVRVTGTTKTETGIERSAVSSAPMAKALKNDYPEVADAVRIDMREEIVQLQNEQVLQGGIVLTDPSFFTVFTYRLIRGNQATALKEPYSLVLTQSTAKKYFGDKDPVGKQLVLNMHDSTGRGAAYTITGIIPDPPQNAHFTFNMLASFSTIEKARPEILTTDGWGDASYYTYLLLKDGVDQQAFSKKIALFYGKYIGERFNIWRNIYTYQVQPLRDIYLYSDLRGEIAATGSISQVYVFLSIGIFILLLAGINYTNLATARSTARAKEVGIKKVAGAFKRQLIMQFLSESVFTAFIALLLACLLAVFLQPFFLQLTGKDVSLFSSPLLLIIVAGVTLALGLVAGIYPALVLSSFKPVTILKGSFKSSIKGIVLRKTLVVSQFVITLVLITGIIVIHSQMSFIRYKELGFNKDALFFLRVNGNTDVIQGYESFKNDLLASSFVSGITTSNSLIGGGLGSGGSETIDKDGNPLQVQTARLRVDPKYTEVYGIPMIAGKDFTPTASANDSIRPVILNQMAVRKFGWQSDEAAVGKPFKISGEPGIVIGVTSDFHYSSLRSAIEPLAIYPVSNRFSRITLRVDMNRPDQSVTFIEKTWRKHFPSVLFDYGFLDQEIGRAYAGEQRFSKIFLYFSILSLLIACLGLYGLIAYTTSQKTKEIGIRKVLGASAAGIATMLSKDFIKPVLIACCIAVPISWYAMNTWLQNFAYRVNIGWWMFATAGGIILLIALITVSFEAIKAAVARPVKSLRTE